MSVYFGACVVLGSLCAGLLAIAAWLWATRHRTSIPGPPTLPLLGNALIFYKLPVLWDRLGKLHRRYGDIFRFYVGPKLVIVLTQPEDIQSLMVTSKHRYRDPYMGFILRSFLGDGLLTTEGETWRKHRKNLEPIFHTTELERFMEQFNDAGNFLCEHLAEKQGTEVELYPALVLTTLRSVAATIFGLNLEWIFPIRDRLSEVIDILAEFGVTVGALIYRPWATLNWIRWMTAEGRTLTKVVDVVENMVDRGFELATKQLDGLKASDRTALSFLLEEKNKKLSFTEKELRDNTKTLAAAGVETTATTLGFILTLLGLHPEWQEEAQRELDDYFGTGGDYFRAVTTEDLHQLKVIDAIIKESLRLFASVPVMPYLATEDVSLAGGRHVAPRGSTLLIAYFLMHRHPKLFPDPDKFDPGRFLEGGSATTRIPYSYIPFGVGTHKCIGARYASLQIKVIVATLLRHYRILPGSSREDLEESVISITSHPITGIRVTFVPRDNLPSNPM